MEPCIFKAIVFLQILLSIPAGAAAANRTVKVELYSLYNITSLRLEPSEGKSFAGETLLAGPVTVDLKGDSVSVKLHSAETTRKKKLIIKSFGRGIWLSGKKIPRRLYKGTIEITPLKKTLKIVNELPLEDYLMSVVSAEASDLSQDEAHKAQAVAARTYTVRLLTNHSREGFNMCDSTHCQLYTGFANVRKKAAAACQATRGELLAYKGKPASTFYHSVCGGRTESMTYVWPFEHRPYLVSVKDGPASSPYCSIAPRFRWKTKISVNALSRISGLMKWMQPGDTAVSLRITERGASKRAYELELCTASGKKTRISATEFYHSVGRKAGWEAVRSTFFEIYSGKDFIILEGKGNGHGVGMCQWGAEGMSRKGFGYREILFHYYPGTEIIYD